MGLVAMLHVQLNVMGDAYSVIGDNIMTPNMLVACCIGIIILLTVMFSWSI